MAWQNLSEDIAAEFGTLTYREAERDDALERARSRTLAWHREYNQQYYWQHKLTNVRKRRADALPPGDAHRAAVKAYQARHRALGLCTRCPNATGGKRLCKMCSRKKTSSRSRHRKPRVARKPVCRCGAMLPKKCKSLCCNCLQAIRAAYIARRKAVKVAC